MTSPESPESVVDVAWLARRSAGRAADGASGLVVLDVTAVLPAPEFDGDYRLESGLDRWREAHIPGSRHADLVGEFSEHPAPQHFTHLGRQELAELLGRYGAAAGREVVLYDNSGGIWAARLWWSLRAIGIPAAVLDGGLEAWRVAGQPVVSGQDEPTADVAETLAVGPGLDAWADADEVAAISDGSAPGTLVCALGRDQFDGTAPTRYSRRGHIPGSLNLPARSLVTADSGLLAAGEQLRETVRPLLEAPGPVVVYCGGGISAALLALGLVRAGREDVKIYDGSLEEWTADPTRPVVVGTD
jgi:thiosulfate/3-mercaptopyruvate sulfurtransferase